MINRKNKTNTKRNTNQPKNDYQELNGNKRLQHNASDIETILLNNGNRIYKHL